MIDLLDTAWISRLWTYQEFLLSSNPIFVCGQHHLPWPQMARAMLFLRETVDRYGTQPSRWVNLIISKHSMLPAQEASDLANYWIFILRISSVYWALVYSFVPLLLTLFFITIWIFFYDTGLRLGHGLTKPALYILIAFVSFLALCAAVLARCLHRYRYWCVNPGPTGDDFLVELYTRRAKDPKDMAYGAWAVLKRKGGAMGMPNSSSGVGDVYRAFTRYFVKTMGSSEIVLLAAARGYTGQPSWVPDLGGREAHGWWECLRRQMGGRDRRVGGGNRLERYEGGLEHRFTMSGGIQVLSMRAVRMHDIKGVYAFKTTSAKYVEAEVPLHLHNLDVFRKLGEQYLHDYRSNTNRPNATALTTAEISTWTSFMRALLHSDVPSATSLLLQILNPQPHTSIFSTLWPRLTPHPPTLSQTHLQICNQLSHQKITAFATTPHPYAPIRTLNTISRRPTIAWSGPHAFSPTGRCSADVKAGDQIILLEDISQPIVVRRIPGRSKRKVQIVSLADYKEGIPEGCEFEEEGWWDVH